jgi:outer membrane receptor protein involved in Fe transport
VQVRRGTPIAGLPAHTLKLSVDWKVAPALTLGADAQATSSMATQGNEDGLAAGPVAGGAAQSADWRVRGHAQLNLKASWEPAARWELYAHINNVLNRRYETYGAVARNLFAGGDDAANTRFVAPGAPRTVAFGARYRY